MHRHLMGGAFATAPVVCLTLDKWETVSGQFGGYLRRRFGPFIPTRVCLSGALVEGHAILPRYSRPLTFRMRRTSRMGRGI